MSDAHFFYINIYGVFETGVGVCDVTGAGENVKPDSIADNVLILEGVSGVAWDSEILDKDSGTSSPIEVAKDKCGGTAVCLACIRYLLCPGV